MDPINNILVIGLNSDSEVNNPPIRTPGKRRFADFQRTDSGNAKPRGSFAVRKSGIIRINQMQVYPRAKLIVAPCRDMIDQMEPDTPSWAIWSYEDNGDSSSTMADSRRDPALP